MRLFSSMAENFLCPSKSYNCLLINSYEDHAHLFFKAIQFQVNIILEDFLMQYGTCRIKYNREANHNVWDSVQRRRCPYEE